MLSTLLLSLGFLMIISVRTEILADKNQPKDKKAADVAKAVIESQVMRNGLLNPFSESQNKSS